LFLAEDKARRKRKSNELTEYAFSQFEVIRRLPAPTNALSYSDGDTEDGKKVRRDYERKRRENLSQAFDELRQVLFETYNKKSLDSRQLILAEATKSLKSLSDKKKKDNDEWISTHINDIPGLRDLVRSIAPENPRHKCCPHSVVVPFTYRIAFLGIASSSFLFFAFFDYVCLFWSKSNY
jgi:hypothetical protein